MDQKDVLKAILNVKKYTKALKVLKYLFSKALQLLCNSYHHLLIQMMRVNLMIKDQGYQVVPMDCN